jgi:hypothetical protein
MTIQRMRSRRPHTCTPYGFSHARLPRTPFLRRSSSSEARGARWRDGWGVTCRVSRLNLRGQGWFQVVISTNHVYAKALESEFASSWISRRDVVTSPMESEHLLSGRLFLLTEGLPAYLSLLSYICVLAIFNGCSGNLTRRLNLELL